MKRSITAIFLAIALLTAFAACGDPAQREPGPVTFQFQATMADGAQNTHTIITDKENLGEALRNEGLIACDEAGYVTTVQGVTLDWDTDKAYWAFYINGVMAMHGVDDETITSGNEYELRYTKG